MVVKVEACVRQIQSPTLTPVSDCVKSPHVSRVTSPLQHWAGLCLVLLVTILRCLPKNWASESHNYLNSDSEDGKEMDIPNTINQLSGNYTFWEQAVGRGLLSDFWFNTGKVKK